MTAPTLTCPHCWSRIDLLQALAEDDARELAVILAGFGEHRGLALVQAGLAWTDVRYCQVRRDAAYRQALDGASQAGLGIWADPEPVAPWDWRRR